MNNTDKSNALKTLSKLIEMANNISKGAHSMDSPIQPPSAVLQPESPPKELTKTISQEWLSNGINDRKQP